MKIKTSVSSARLPAVHSESLRALLKVLLIVFLSSAATYVLMTQILTKDTADRIWKWAADHGHAALRDDISVRDAVWVIPKRLPQIFGSADLPRLAIDIKFKYVKKLEDKRVEALEKGFLIQARGDFVPAIIRHEDRTTKVKLRLKGDLTDHLEGDKWSFRIRVKGKDHIFGMRRFSIQHPKVRGFHAEALFFETLRHVGVLAPRYFFAYVSVNGNSVGIMAVEEHFSKELLENNGRRESVIVRFDESLYWSEGATGVPPGRRVFSSHHNAPIDAFASSRIAKSEKLSAEYALAVSMLRGFVEGEIAASDVFDIESLGRFLAVTQLWGSWHAGRWHNQRFYLNPITAKLEPIGFDANLQSRRPPGQVLSHELHLAAAMLEDPKIFAVYRDTLHKLATEMIDGNLAEKLRTMEQQHLAVLRKEFFLLEALPDHELKDRANRILARNEADWEKPIDTKKPISKVTTGAYPALIHAYRVKDSKGSYLELANAIPHVVEIQSVSWAAKNSNAKSVFQPRAATEFPRRLPATPRGTVPKPQRVYFDPPDNSTQYALNVTANIHGQSGYVTVEARPYYAALTRHPIPLATVEDQLSQHPFLTLDKKQKKLNVLSGLWRVNGSLVVPSGYSLTIPGDTTLQFDAQESLIAHGPLYFKGTENANVLLEGVSHQDEPGLWQGIAVLDAGHLSEWSHLTVRNTMGIKQAGWKLTGGVNFYQSNIKMEHCRFEGNRSEDALNVVHANFELNDIQIVNTTSDGFDADFAKGIINGGQFQGIGTAGGGDGVDVSGSVVTVDGTQFLDISDKALSVGEGSKMSANHVTIAHVGTAAASKDGSTLKISDSSIKDARNVGLMAYIKKPEFGPANIEASDLTFVSTKPLAVAQTGSRITIDGNTVDTENVDVAQLYKTIMKPGLRK